MNKTIITKEEKDKLTSYFALITVLQSIVRDNENKIFNILESRTLSDAIVDLAYQSDLLDDYEEKIKLLFEEHNIVIGEDINDEMDTQGLQEVLGKQA